MEMIIKEKDLLRAIGRVRIITSKNGKVIRTTPWMKNRIMLGTDTGKSLILSRLNGDNTYTLNITHADMGTGTNTPADSDTTLQTVVARVAKVTGSIASNVLTLNFFFSDINLTNNTYREFGMFVDGTSTVSTGKIFNRILFATPYVKSTGEDTTVQATITLT